MIRTHPKNRALPFHMEHILYAREFTYASSPPPACDVLSPNDRLC